jgi:transposase
MADISKKRLVAVWQTMRVADIAKQFSTTEQSVYYWARKYGLQSRLTMAADESTPGADDPSEDEIRERASAIRETWSPEERYRRMVAVGRKSRPDGIRCYKTSDLFGTGEAASFGRI